MRYGHPDQMHNCMTSAVGLLVDRPVSFRFVAWSLVLNTDPPQGVYYIATYCNSHVRIGSKSVHNIFATNESSSWT